MPGSKCAVFCAEQQRGAAERSLSGCARVAQSRHRSPQYWLPNTEETLNPLTHWNLALNIFPQRLWGEWTSSATDHMSSRRCYMDCLLLTLYYTLNGPDPQRCRMPDSHWFGVVSTALWTCVSCYFPRIKMYEQMTQLVIFNQIQASI